MQALAGFTMRGRSQAALVASASAVFSLLVPLFGLISGAAVALVTLRHGVVEGLIVGGIAGMASGALAFLALGSPLPAIGFAVALWLPVWILAVVLRYSRSLGLTIQLAAIFGLVILIGIHWQQADPAHYWADVLEPLRQSLVQGGVIDAKRSQAIVSEIARWMTGAFAAAFYFQVLLSLMLARWWQALLYNPGGFGAEFRELRLRSALGYVVFALLAVLAFAKEALWAAELLLLLAPLFVLQGLAVVHALANRFGLHRLWLVGFYVLLVVAMPHAEVGVASIGLADLWVNARAKRRPHPPGKG
jgi:Predicted membrane protein (DUF2232)